MAKRGKRAELNVYDDAISQEALDYMLDIILDHEKGCSVCKYNFDCNCNSVRGGPNGPIYAPCCDGPGSWVDEDSIKKVYDEILEEEMIMIKRVLFNEPATIVWWEDGTKTVVKAEGETFDKEKGLAMATAKKHFGNKGSYWNEFKKWIEEK